MRENKKRWSVGLAGVTVIATVVLGLVLEATPAVAQTTTDSSGQRIAAGTRTTARWVGAVNTSSREAVNRAYWSQFAPKLSLPVLWLGGSILGCLPGLSALSSNAATLSALNYVRSLSGLAPVAFSPAMNANAQRAALIMDANNALDHTPSSSWRCWSQTGATTANRSNLALAWPELKSGQIIDMYMDDRGDSNKAVGHRRWILNPFSTVMGTGSTSTANALTVIGPTNSSRPNPRYVGWPTAGWFPNTMEPAGRWSLSAGLRSVIFRDARVRVYRNGVRVPATKYAVHGGYAQPTLVWQLGTSVPRTGNFKVVVTNIKRRGLSRTLSYTYGVNLFTPYK